MKDVRIVIVSWNVEALLQRCLASLPAACEGVDWEVVVVDNASEDHSVNRAMEFATRRSECVVIRNTENRGFAKACNQGIAGSSARYILLLNPDTVCPAEVIKDFVHHADHYPDAGIFGPALQNPDGSHQQSVRSFPTVWDQAAILLKLHHVFPKWNVFQKYFFPYGAAFTRSAEQARRVDQVMGAAFMIRREVIDMIGGLDERYFIWFEEVDYCRAAKAAGWATMSLPHVSFVHHGGTSFAQVMSVKKQRMFSESMSHYFQKWHPGWRARLMWFLRPVSILLASIINVVKTRPWIAWMAGIAAFELISRATVFHPAPRAAVTIFAGGIMAVIAMRKPQIGLILLLTELMIGSKGSLTKIPDGWEVDGGLSLRMVLTGSFVAGWVMSRVIRGRRNAWSFTQFFQTRKAWIALSLLILYAAVRGFLSGNAALLQDVNAWLELVLLLPVLDVARRDGQRLVRTATDAIVAALLWLPVKTLGLLYIFSHGITSMSQPFYLWVRRTGVGEVTLVTGNLFRIFIQSQVYALFGFLTSVSFCLGRITRHASRIVFMIMTASAVSILISLSRSFWVGLFFGLITLGVLYFFGPRPRTLLKTAGVIFGSFLFAFGLIFATVSFPLPKVDVGSLGTLFGSRGSTADAAAMSRWNLLPVLAEKITAAPIAGHGFGATVTYQTKDPRILAKNPEGWYTTHAFEWGWLEFWVKFGIFGIPVMLWLLASIGTRVWKTDGAWWVRAGLVSSLVTIAALHVFTPYLNHPLGFGFLLALEGYIEAKHAISKRCPEQNHPHPSATSPRVGCA